MQLHTRSAKTIPLALSLISAGPATEVVDECKYLDVNALITRGREGFAAFEVTGDSMVDHIRPGNLIFIDTWAQPKNGDIIASSVNGLTCVKIFQQNPTGLYLVSANTQYQPRQITADDNFHVLGVVKAHLAIH